METKSLQNMKEDDLMKIVNKINECDIRYNAEKKKLLFSHSNFKEKYIE